MFLNLPTKEWFEEATQTLTYASATCPLCLEHEFYDENEHLLMSKDMLQLVIKQCETIKRQAKEINQLKKEIDLMQKKVNTTI